SHRDSRVYFGSSGAEAIETAIKLARAARPNGTTFINFQRAYHGKTSGALALTPNEEYQAPFRPLAPDVVTLPYGDTDALERALKQLGKRACAIVVEPVQGEGGVVTPPPGFLARLGGLARAPGGPVIAGQNAPAPDRLERARKQLGRRACAIVVEPVQGEGGVVTPPPGFLARLGELARAHGVLVIADEIQTGLGRTGHWFASVAAGLDPDVVTLAK